MTEKEHLQCEIKELELEIENHGKAIQNLINVQNRRKQKLEELQRQKPITLQRIIAECVISHNSGMEMEVLENILDRVEVEWLPLEGCHELKSCDYSEGWNNCIKHIKKRLRE
jgi:chromosome segregation ATPase